MFSLSKIFGCCGCSNNVGSSVQSFTTYNSIIYSNNSDIIYLNYGKPVATQTIVFPSAPADGQELLINSAYAITLLTLSSSYAIQGYSGPVYFAGTPPIRYVFNANSSTWIIS